MVLFSPFRRRPDLLQPPQRRRQRPRIRLLRHPDRELRPLGTALPAQLRHLGDDALRQGWGGARDRRLRAAFQAPRPSVPADDDGAPRPAGHRPSADHHTAPPRLRLRRRSAAVDTGQQSHPLCRAAGDASLHDRRPDHLRGRGSPLRARGALHHDAGGRREPDQLHRRDLAGVLQAHPGVLARMGALPGGSLRVAGGGDPRRHHAQALQLRGKAVASSPP